MGSKVQFWGPISLCLCAFLGLEWGRPGIGKLYARKHRPEHIFRSFSPPPVRRFSWKKSRMPTMTGRPGYRTMEMIGGSSAPYLTRTPCVPLFCTSFNRVGNKERFRLPGAGGGSFPLYGGTFARSYSVSKKGRIIRTGDFSPMKKLGYVFFLPPLFCQRIPAVWTQNLGKNRLISANVG